MRLLHVVPTYLPATRYGGPIYAVHGLCRALARRGHHVEVLTTSVDGEHDSDVPIAVSVILEGVEVRYFEARSPILPRRIGRRLYVAPAMRRELDARVDSFDLVHLHSVFLWPTLTAARAAHARSVPYVVSPRGMLVPELVRARSTIAKSLWILFVEQRTFRHAAGIHFTSQREWDDARRLAIPLPAPFIVPNGIDLPHEEPAERETNSLLFLGRINWKKGLDRIIDALSLVPGARLRIVGNDEERLIPQLLKQASRNGVADRVVFRAHVGGSEKDHLLASATALVLPSRSENFGNVVLEAMAYATPVIVTPEVGLADDVAAAHAGIVTSGDPAALAGAIRTMLSDGAARKVMGRNGRELVERRFVWRHVAELMEREYERIVEQRRGRENRAPSVIA